MAVLPSVGRSRGDVGTDDNLLFFGIFTSLSEAEFSDRMMALVSDDDALCRAMLRDMYQNGQVLQRRKYRWSTCPFRSEEHTSELQSLMRISYAVFCLKKKKKKKNNHTEQT